MKKMCRCCEEREAKCGSFCSQCLKLMKEDKKKQKDNERYWRSVEEGAGDLWHEN